jgi:hypothetical protein
VYSLDEAIRKAQQQIREQQLTVHIIPEAVRRLGELIAKGETTVRRSSKEPDAIGTFLLMKWLEKTYKRGERDEYPGQK